MLHYTAMAWAEDARHRLCDPAAGVSAHYLIGRDGTCWHLVDEAMRAWHAGVGDWGGIADMNSRSIGIELANTGAEPFPEPMMAALEGLLRGIFGRWDMAPERVIGHADMALGRKVDPGPRLDWRRLARGGFGVWPAAADPGDFAADAARFGYRAGPDQEAALLQAFRDRFRPGVEGPLDDADRRVMSALARDWPARGP